MQKGRPLRITPFVIWWRRREFESSLSLDRPTLRFGHPSRPGAGSAVTAAKNKKGHLKVDPFLFYGGGGGSLSLRYRSTDLRCASATRAVPARVQLSQPLKTKKATLKGDLFCFMVEAAGVEPASASTLPLALHA